MASIDAVNIPPQFSFDGGTTWKLLVCVKNYSLTGSTAKTETETFCGKVTGLGTPSMTGSASAVGDFGDSSVISMAEVFDAFLNKTAMKFKATDSGGDFLVTADSVFTSFTASNQVSDSASFDCEWSMDNVSN